MPRIPEALKTLEPCTTFSFCGLVWIIPENAIKGSVFQIVSTRACVPACVRACVRVARVNVRARVRVARVNVPVSS